MHRLLTSILLCALVAAGCTGSFLALPPASSEINTQHFVVVKAGPRDTLTSLARTYLGSSDKAWRIAAYNNIEVLKPGQRVVIPKAPLSPGGIYQDGYQTVPILIYPALTSRPSKSKAVHVGTFDRQMQYLNENGFDTVSLDQLHAFLSQADQLPPLAVMVTFDTTKSWVYELAFPILKKHGMRAALFIRPGEVGTKDRVTWLQLAEMAAGGMDIGLYGTSFKSPAKENLKKFFDAFEKKFTQPQLIFRSRLKVPCRDYAYPGGKTNDLTIAMLKKHGYRTAFTRTRGHTPFFADNYKIKRSYIYGNFDMNRFRQNLKTFRSAELQ